MNLLEYDSKFLDIILKTIEKRMSQLEFFKTRGEMDSEMFQELETLSTFKLKLYDALTISIDREN